MQYRKLQGTGLTVPRLTLGTMMFGGQTSEEDSLKIMDYAYDHGMYFWDTADIYVQGEGEKVVGKSLLQPCLINYQKLLIQTALCSGTLSKRVLQPMMIF